MNSKELWAERKKLADAQASLMADGKTEDALKVEGQITQLDITIDHVIAEEDAMRNAAPKPEPKFLTLADAVLGSRDEFKGLSTNFVKDDVVYVPGPNVIDPTLDPKQANLLAAFAATLPETPGSGSIEYMQRGTQVGAPATWAEPTLADNAYTSAAKSPVIYKWVKKIAIKETIAGYVPISEATLADYDELYSIINGDLIMDTNEQADQRYLTGNSSTGIIGILNTPGIQSWTTGAAGAYFDVIRKMRTKVLEQRRVPTHVCVNPAIKEAIDLYKTTTNYYQYLGDTPIWGMQLVEDANCAGILVYDAYAAERKAIRNMAVKVGTVNDQFTHNELTIRAELTKALKVKVPGAFIYGTKADIDKAVA